MKEEIRKRIRDRGWSVTHLAKVMGAKRPLVSHMIHWTRKAPIKWFKLMLYELDYTKEEVDRMTIQYENFYIHKKIDQLKSKLK